MIKCLKCQSIIPNWKMLFISKIKPIKCMSCSTRFITNYKIVSAYGIIMISLGGLQGGLIGWLMINWLNTGNQIYLWLLIPVPLLALFIAWLAGIKFLKLEIYD